MPKSTNGSGFKPSSEAFRTRSHCPSFVAPSLPPEHSRFPLHKQARAEAAEMKAKKRELRSARSLSSFFLPSRSEEPSLGSSRVDRVGFMRRASSLGPPRQRPEKSWHRLHLLITEERFQERELLGTETGPGSLSPSTEGGPFAPHSLYRFVGWLSKAGLTPVFGCKTGSWGQESLPGR